MRREFYYT